MILRDQTLKSTGAQTHGGYLISVESAKLFYMYKKSEKGAKPCIKWGLTRNYP